MDKDQAKSLINSFLGRLESRAAGLSEEEVRAVKLLCEAPEPSTLAPQKVERAYKLNLSAFKRNGPSPKKLRICLDFGTAMSKAWATGRESKDTLPLVLNKKSGRDESPFAVPSSIFIADNGRIYLGKDAELQHGPLAGSGRKRFDNLKRMLSEVPVGTDLATLTLDPTLDPTRSGLTKGDLLVLYLAWLTDLSELALDEAAELVEGELVPTGSDLRAVTRRFAIPCFEDANDEQARGPERAAWARSTMQESLLRAQILADSLAGHWNELETKSLAVLMEKLRRTNVSKLAHLLPDDAAIREPIAAGASRFDSVLAPKAGVARPPIRRLLMVVDSGAGTTDFAMFQAVIPTGDDRPHYALLTPSVQMTRVAGNAIDEILRPLVLNCCNINPETGGPRSKEDFEYIRMDLDSQIRQIKRRLFEGKRIQVNLNPNANGTLELESLLSDRMMKKYEQELLEIRSDVVRRCFSPDSLESLRFADTVCIVDVLLTGGSSGVPIVKDLSEGHFDLDGVRFRFEPVTEFPQWILRLPREQVQLVSSSYPQCAVAIGGSAAKLPLELSDYQSAAVSPRSGPRILERFRTEGL